jgi:hypothetical protein
VLKHHEDLRGVTESALADLLEEARVAAG